MGDRFRPEYALMEDLRANLPAGILDRFTVGYGVVFPDCDFRYEGAEWDRAMVADARASRDLEGWLRRLFGYWRGRHGRVSGPDEGQDLFEKRCLETLDGILRSDAA